MKKIILSTFLLVSIVLTSQAEEFGKKQPFRGKLTDPEMVGYQIAAKPLVGFVTSFELDEKGRIYLIESDRLSNGVVDIRHSGTLTAGDFRLQTVEDRHKQLSEDKSFAEGYFTKHSEKVARLEDLNGDGVMDKRTEFAGEMNEVTSGLSFSALAEGPDLYLTSIPYLWKFTDTDDDGVSDKREKLLDGFGVRSSMMGHDMHGITRGPDGRLYWSIGDRGFNVTTKEGKQLKAPSRGAIFRSDSDGSNLEVIYHGLRNPQEIGFDQYGNLFTFDNTGDIGDKARVIYVQEGGDAGWYEEHQVAHHYRNRLDFKDIALPKSIWVSEKMFATRNDEQPKWVLPPVAHVGNGPSGVVYLTGESLPENLRDTFLVCDYRGNPGKSELLSVRLTNEGAGFKVENLQRVMSGVACSDVDLGYDGRVYALDFGGGWSRNSNGSVQVFESPQHLVAASVTETRELFAQGFEALTVDKLAALLGHPDMRVRQRAQHVLVARKEAKHLLHAAKNGAVLTTRLHGIWGITQLARVQPELAALLVHFTKDPEMEVRANAVRSLGDLRAPAAREALRARLSDDSLRVQSLATIALGKCGTLEDAPAIWDVIQANNGSDLFIRHAGIVALEFLLDRAGAQSMTSNPSEEVRLCAVILLRRMKDPQVAKFISDGSTTIRIEAIRAVYDLHLESGFPELAKLSSSAATFAPTIQRRILFANFWMGSGEDAARVLSMVNDPKIDKGVRETALRALLRWNNPPTMNPVTGFYRPIEKREVNLLASIETPLREGLIKADKQSRTLMLELAQSINMKMSAEALEAQVTNDKLDDALRVASLNALSVQTDYDLPSLLEKLTDTKSGSLQAARLNLLFEHKLPGRLESAQQLVKSTSLPAVRAALAALAMEDAGKTTLTEAFENRGKALPAAAHLDAYLALKNSSDPKLQQLATTFAAEDPGAVHGLMIHGGNIPAGKKVFENQGACMQCHQIDHSGGNQGPPLDGVGKRLEPKKILESLLNPNAEIAEGFGLFTLTTNSGEALTGRLASKTDKRIELMLPSGDRKIIKTADVKTQTGPVSAMPPMALALPPKDVRDIIAYLSSLKKPGKGH